MVIAEASIHPLAVASIGIIALIVTAIAFRRSYRSLGFGYSRKEKLDTWKKQREEDEEWLKKLVKYLSYKYRIAPSTLQVQPVPKDLEDRVREHYDLGPSIHHRYISDSGDIISKDHIYLSATWVLPNRWLFIQAHTDGYGWFLWFFSKDLRNGETKSAGACEIETNQPILTDLSTPNVSDVLEVDVSLDILKEFEHDMKSSDTAFQPPHS